MIVSVSRRTDIPAFYTPWLMNRLREGFALVRSPRNSKRTRFVSLAPSDVDCIVFWTKNAIPLFKYLDEFEEREITYFVQWTITPYGAEIEPGVPPKEELLDGFRELSVRLGSHRTIWRYDPIIIGGAFSAERHLKTFSSMCAALEGYTERCVVSFVDVYGKLRGRGIVPANEEEMRRVAGGFAPIALGRSISLQTCCEAVDLSGEGVAHGACIDASLVERLARRPLYLKKDRNQRPRCECVESVDIGAYDTCPAGCRYCYATRSETAVRAGAAACDPSSPLLVGEPSSEERELLRRHRRSGRQLDLFGGGC